MKIISIQPGQKFNRLTAITAAKSKGGHKFWVFRCKCGNIRTVRVDRVVSGATQSCRCARRVAMTHGRTGTPEHCTWLRMKGRCNNPRDRRYAAYGGRGITVCERWLSFENFWADMGEKPAPGYSIDRINNDGDYEPSNCRWATAAEQASNRRDNVMITFQGQTMCQERWAKAKGMARSTLARRLALWGVERALTEPLRW